MIGQIPGPPSGTGGTPEGSFRGAGAVPSYETVLAPAPPPRPPRCRAGGLIVGTLGFAPWERSSFIAGTSVAYAARQNGVAPRKSTRRLSRLYVVYQRLRLRRTLGSAFASSSTFISSRYVVFCWRLNVGCGVREL